MAIFVINVPTYSKKSRNLHHSTQRSVHGRLGLVFAQTAGEKLGGTWQASKTKRKEKENNFFGPIQP